MINKIVWLMIKTGLRLTTIDRIFYDLFKRHIVGCTDYNKKYAKIKRFYFYLAPKEVLK
jgi:hypothetical protein